MNKKEQEINFFSYIERTRQSTIWVVYNCDPVL